MSQQKNEGRKDFSYRKTPFLVLEFSFSFTVMLLLKEEKFNRIGLTNSCNVEITLK